MQPSPNMPKFQHPSPPPSSRGMGTRKEAASSASGHTQANASSTASWLAPSTLRMASRESSRQVSVSHHGQRHLLAGQLGPAQVVQLGEDAGHGGVLQAAHGAQQVQRAVQLVRVAALHGALHVAAGGGKEGGRKGEVGELHGLHRRQQVPQRSVQLGGVRLGNLSVDALMR